MNSFHVAVHVPFGERPFAVPTNNLLAFHQFYAPALVANLLPTVTHVAMLVVFAAICMASVTPFSAIRALHALGAVGLQQLFGTLAFAAVGAQMLQSEIQYVNYHK